jgi:hypothetical protein
MLCAGGPKEWLVLQGLHSESYTATYIYISALKI